MLEFIGYIIVSWISADFLTGLFHWWEDRYSDPNWPIIGKLVAEPNLRHHEDPLHFTKGNYFYRNYTTLIPCLIIFFLIFPNKWCIIPLMASQANEIHCWSHLKCNWFIRMLQSTGIIQGPKSHLIHHKSPYEVRFCVMTDWLNPFLDTLQFWRLLEVVAFKFFGWKVRDANE